MLQRFAIFPVGRNLQNGRTAQSAMGEEHFFAEGLMIRRGCHGRGNAREIAIEPVLSFGKHERHEGRPGRYNLESELTGELVAQRSRADFGDGKTACCNDQGGGAKFAGPGMDHEVRAVLNLPDSDAHKYFHTGVAALGLQHGGDVPCAAVAEKLAECFFVIRNAVLFDQGDEVRRRIAGKRRFGEVFVCADKFLRGAMEIREVAAAAAGDEDFLADAVRKRFKDGHTAPLASASAQPSRSAGAKNKNVKFAS